MQIAFWIFVGIILFTYVGYALSLHIISFFIRKKKPANLPEDLPEVTLVVAAFNEIDIVESKINNSRELDYPADKLKLVWITDGSDDGTPDALNKYDDVQVYHKPERKGKTAALNRVIDYVSTPIVVFTDANTFLNSACIKNIVKTFSSDETVGCVAGEKRIRNAKVDAATGAGEGIYWKYESYLKKLESKTGSTMGAVGEIFAVRTSLFEKVPDSCIIDDFVISIKVAAKGYRIQYAPGSMAFEEPSQNTKDEMKRKVRIASGGYQTLFMFPELLNFFKFGLLSYKYLIHKVFRWFFAPVSFVFLLITNLFIVYQQFNTNNIYYYFLLVQIAVYVLVIIGALLRNSHTKLKFLFAPYYFFLMNLAQILGLIKFLKKDHSVIWEKVERRK